MAFSPVGLALALAVLAPSLLLLVLPPRDETVEARVPPLLTILERAGQVGCLVACTIALRPASPDLWLGLALLCLLAYYAVWARYLLRGRRFALLFAPIGPVPVPLAILPVLVFGLTSGWGRSWWLASAAVVLAVGHVWSSLIVARAVRERRRSGA